MPTAAEVTALEFQIDIDGSTAQRQIRKIEQQWKQSTAKIVAATKDYDHYVKGVVNSAKSFGTEYTSSIKMTSKQLTLLNRKMEELNREIDTNARLSKSASDVEQKGIQKTITGLKQQLDVLQQIEKAQRGANYEKVFGEVAKSFGADLKKESEEAFRSALEGAAKFSKADMAKGMTEAFQDAAGSLKGKDFGGMVKGLAGIIGQGAKGLGGMATRAGLRAQNDPNAGGVSKALGSMLGKMGPMINTIAKLGPILSAAGGAVMAIVKLFLDAEAAAKEFNKEVLSAASSGEFLAKNAGVASAAFDELSETLKSIRNTAFSLDNLNWGINAKEHSSFLNVLNAEGVSLARIKQEAESAKKEVGAFSADMVHVAVAYSRNFGVSLQEISSFQSEMMTELGSSFATAQNQFALMAQAAGESGMAQNKFFNIIKSVSSDLSLYNMRLEDSVHLLTLLGKTMNPRNAQKFMQETMQGFKNMGRTEKLKMTLLAGADKTRKIVEKDMMSKTKDVATKLAAAGAKGSVEEIQKAIEAGGGAAEKYLSDIPDAMKGEMRDAISQIEIDRKRMGKGVFGLSTATGNLGMGGVLDMYKAAIGRFGGNDLEEAAGSVGGEMIAEQLGISQERLDSMIKLEKAVKAQKKVLIANGKDAAEVEKMGTQDVIATMSEDAQKALKKDTEVINYAKQQSELTQSTLDKLDTIMQWLMNQFYNTILDIYDAMLSIPGVGDKGKKAKLDLARYAQSSTSKAVKDAFGQSGGDLWKFRDVGIKKVADQAWGAKSQIDTLTEARKSAKTDSEKARIDASIGSLQNMLADQFKSFDSNLYAPERSQLVGKLSDKDKAAKIQAELTKDPKKSIEEAIKAAGLSEKITNQDLAEMVSQAGWLIDPTMSNPGMLAKNLENQEKIGQKYGVAGAPAAPVAAPAPAAAPIAIAAPVAAGTTAAPVAAVVPAAAPVGPGPKKDDLPTTAKQGEDTITAIEDVQTKLNKVKLDKPFMKNEFQARVEAGVLDAVRVALYEYWMYSGLNRDDVLKKGGYDPMSFGKNLVKAKGDSLKEKEANLTLDGNAVGGTVLNPAPGEVIASVAPGETIVPKGGLKGGGGNVYQTFAAGTDQNFAKYIESKTKQAIIDWERAKKLR